jgi:hypothetical protein
MVSAGAERAGLQSEDHRNREEKAMQVWFAIGLVTLYAAIPDIVRGVQWLAGRRLPTIAPTAGAAELAT